MVNTKKNQYSSEHKLFTFTPTDSSDYEIFEDMKIDQELKQYTDWFKNNQVSAKKYNFKKYVNAPPIESDRTVSSNESYVSVQIFDKKIDTLFRLTWV
tara:strand:- start:1257 stop:1550 length:294 start_codon:yes stop_codon:yes gene_type:complete